MTQHAHNRDAMRHHRAHQSKNVFGDSFMERVAQGVANAMGTSAFVVMGSLLILAWVLINNAIPYAEETVRHLEHGKSFDPVPWVLLNLIFSGVAFYTGSLVIIAQKAQSKRDQAREVADANHRQELADEQTKLLRANTDLTEQVHALTQEVRALIEPSPKPKAVRSRKATK